MRLTGYAGPWKHSMPQTHVADDGSHWHAATPSEIENLPDDGEVYFSSGGTDQPVRVKREYDVMRLPGNYPFLQGMAALVPVYIRGDAPE